MLRRLRRINAERGVDGKERVVKYLKDCLNSSTYYVCLKNSLIHSEISGNPGEILLSFGGLLVVNPSVALISLAKVLADKEIESKAGKGLISLVKIAAYVLGPYQLFNALVESRNYASNAVFKELISSSTCTDLVRIGDIINSDSRVPTEYALAFIKEVMSREGCFGGKEEALKTAISLLRQNKITLKQLKDLLGKKRLKILITRKKGKVNKVFLYLGDELIAEGTDKDYVVDLLALSNQLSQNSVGVYS